jgi:phosphoenolpyruvate synthase/pyruvate phosphate dikinase
MQFIKDFKNVSKNDVEIAGGKGSSLGAMTKMGLLVPSGFVILSNTFEKFLEAADLNVAINAILHSVNKKEMHAIENASKKIKALILQAEIPEDITKEIRKYFKKLGTRYVAVRSSATAEDSANAAWAGQLESYLNTTAKNLLENVRKCWASLFTPRAIFYRLEKKLHYQKISVAVVIQKMVKSEVSGVIFSVHPVTQNKHQLIIEAGFGLGEAVVSGKITPDSYIVDKNDWYIVDKHINTEKNEQKIQKLSDGEIIKLAKLAVKIEKAFGFPVDVEWAKEKDNFYITQSRPITTMNGSASANQNTFDYIKSQRWFFGVRADESLFFYSAKTGGYDYIKQKYKISFAETLLIPLRKNYPIRVFNLLQAKDFHSVSNRKIRKDPEILALYIQKDNVVYKKIDIKGEKILLALKKDNYDHSVSLFKELLSLYEIVSAHFIIIFSLGLKLAENINNLHGIKSVIKAHDFWRNSVAFKEERMGETFFHFFKYLITKKGLMLDPVLLMKFITTNEIKAWLANDLTDEAIQKKIILRKNQGFVYLNLRDKSREVIDDLSEIKKIQKYFLKLDRDSKKLKSGNDIFGQVAYNPKKLVKGSIVIIKDKAKLKDKSHLIDGKILVAIQTTPHFIPYMKKAKAIITDEGGLTCHAAIIAREFRIPCVVGTKIATQVLKDGDFVEINMDNGVIKIKKK